MKRRLKIVDMAQATTCLLEDRLPELGATKVQVLAGSGVRICTAGIGKADSQQHLLPLAPRT